MNLKEEADCLRSLIASAREKATNEMNFIGRDFMENDVNGAYLSSNEFNREMLSVEGVVSRHHADLQVLTRELFGELLGHHESRERKKTEIAGSSSSVVSFLTEEEDQIKKISVRIRQVG